MADILQIENQKIDSEYVLRDTNIKKLDISKSRFLSGISFSSCTLDIFSIGGDTKTKGNIIFKNCVFTDTVLISKVNCLGSVDFIDCHFSKSLKIFSCKVKNQFNLLGCRISNDLVVQDLSAASLLLEEVTSKNIRINSKYGSTIDDFCAKNSNIEHEFELSEVHETAKITLQNCNVGFLLSIQKIVSSAQLDSLLINSYTKNLKINNIESGNKINLNVLECITEKTQITKFAAPLGLIDFSYTNTSGITKIGEVGENIKVDISNLATSELLIDDSFYNSITKTNSTSQLLLSNTGQQIKTLQILEKYFHQKGDTSRQDKITFILRSLEVFQKSNFSKSKKLLFKIHYLVGKYFFGWGVKLRPLFVSFFCFTAFFALIYFYIMERCNDYSFYFKDIKYTGIFAPFELSIFYMMGFYADIKVSCINYTLGLIQHLIGLAYLTLIIGVGIRKLVN